jgi:glycosyltransferase involved in cell wall biosynthesis
MQGITVVERQSDCINPRHRLKLMMLTVGLDVGGTECQILDLSSRLNASRYDVSVCVLKGEGSIGREFRDRGIRIFALGGMGKWDVRLLFRLWRVLRREQPDIVHAFLFHANIASRIVGWVLKVPVVIGSYRGVEIYGKWPLALIDRLTSSWAHASTCCSQAVRQSVLFRIGGEKGKSVVIHNGIDILRFEGKTSLSRADIGVCDGVPIIGTVCRLDEPVKGVTSLLQAFQLLLKMPGMGRARLLLVGDGPSRCKLEELANVLGIAKQLVFTGMRRDVEKILPLMDLFVLPSQYEGFGIAIVEAMAAARPVVATAVGGIPEIVIHGETGLLVSSGDVAELADAMCRMLTDPKTSAAYGSAGLRRAREQFSIATAVKRHEELYEDLFSVYTMQARQKIGVARSASQS